MAWLASLDIAAFRWINQSLSNPALDWLMPFLSGNSIFFPILGLLVVWTAWKGGRRGRVFLLVLALAIVVIDVLLCSALKEAVGRARPFTVLADTRVLVGRGNSLSMPSSHATNWFAATLVAALYYRRSLWLMLPLAIAVSLSRIYNGVHYPSDVLAGALLGAGGAASLAWFVDRLWREVGQRWFPQWWASLPSLLQPESRLTSDKLSGSRPLANQPQRDLDQHWLRLGYVIIGLLLAIRLAYVASGQIDLSEDEAYQWTWSKHLALSYYSKPLLIAYVQFLGTTLWRDTVFGVRFFSPVIGALLSLLLLRFMAREVNARVALAVLLAASTTPMLAVGAILMTIDPLSVLFWVAAMITGWRAARFGGTRIWLLTGLWIGLGFLSKFTALLQLICWVLFFVLWRPARAQLRRPGPYMALGIALLCTLPVLVWNAQHGWITAKHVAADGGLYQVWRPTLRFVWDFIGAEAGLLNPIYLGGALWAAAAFWRRYRQEGLMVYLFCMGAPLFLGFGLYTLRSRVLPNWIAPSVLPLLCLMAVYWERRWREGARLVPKWLLAGSILGGLAVIVLHDTDIIGKVAGRPLPPKLDPLRRVRAWKQTAQVVRTAWTTLAAEGKPAFIIGDHYGIVGQLSFYLPEAKAGMPDHPLVYYRASPTPDNQYFFWPGYLERKGENAIYVQQTDRALPPPRLLQEEFASVTDLGIHEVLYHERVFHRLQLFACRGLR